eukprot:scaffold16160_cov73-Cyclotella_meneghiniana.AAC.1
MGMVAGLVGRVLSSSSSSSLLFPGQSCEQGRSLAVCLNQGLGLVGNCKSVTRPKTPYQVENGLPGRKRPTRSKTAY